MDYEKNLLGQKSHEIRHIKLSPLDFKNDLKKFEIPKEILCNLKEAWNKISNDGSVNPSDFRDYLQDLGY